MVVPQPGPFPPVSKLLMSSLSDSDIETLQSIGDDTIHSIVSLCVESIMWSELHRRFRLLIVLTFVTQRCILSLSSLRAIFYCTILTLFSCM